MDTATLTKESASPTGSEERARFAADQVAMTATWYANLLKSGRDVDAHIASRKAAYLARWREAGRYFGPGRRVLDVGGGNSFEDLFAYFGEMGWDYWYLDIGEREAAASAEIGARFGVPAGRFAVGLNHELAYPDGAFDAIFSSHCLEHSMDVELTLRQFNRLLTDRGQIAISVPFGWDPQPNHPYFFSVDEWLTLIEDGGFRIRAYQIGDEYPESGQDLFIAAEKAGPSAVRFRVRPDDFLKSRYAFRSFRAPELVYAGAVDLMQDHAILRDGWSASYPLPEGATETLPILVRHHWSAIVRVGCGEDAVHADLFRPRAAVEPLRLRLSAPAPAGARVKIAPVGRNDASLDAQGVLAGYLTR